jgi:hypothetical protein
MGQLAPYLFKERLPYKAHGGYHLNYSPPLVSRQCYVAKPLGLTIPPAQHYGLIIRRWRRIAATTGIGLVRSSSSALA